MTARDQVYDCWSWCMAFERHPPSSGLKRKDWCNPCMQCLKMAHAVNTKTCYIMLFVCRLVRRRTCAPLFSIGVTLLITKNDYLMKAVTIRQTWSALSGEAEGQIKQIQDSEFSTTSTESVRDNFRPVLLMWRDICGALGHCFPMLHCIRTRRDQWAWPVQGIRTSRFNHIW